jgi:spore coat polysaccharide biosynthesis protein SpsF
MAAGVGRVVLATSGDAEDDVLEMLASRLGVAVFRGDRDDVLRRVAHTVRAFNFDPVLPATLDVPALDLGAPGRVLAALEATGADFIYEEGLPLGAAIEGIRAAALMKAAELATDAYDRRHVTAFVRHRRDLFRVTRIAAPEALCCPLLKLSVDTAADLDGIRELFVRTGSADPSVAALIEASGLRNKKAQSKAQGPRPKAQDSAAELAPFAPLHTSF